MKKQALIIEDNGIDQAINRSILESIGFECTSCSDGDDAISFLLETSFDLILLDMGLPNITGIQFLSGFRSAVLNQEARVVVVSGSADEKMSDLVKFYGAEACLKKPLSIQEHKSILEHGLQPQRAKG